MKRIVGAHLTMARASRRIALGTHLARAVLVVACILTVVPILWVFVASFSAGASLYSSSLIPHRMTPANYLDLFRTTRFATWLRNSAIVCTGGSLLAVALTVTMAYAFSRFRFAGRRYGLLALILIQLLPPSAIIVAIYRLLAILHLLDRFLGLILVYGGLTIPFNAWLMRGYFDSIPIELDESACLDGATRWQAFFYIALPLAMPMVAVIFLFNLISFYNDYLLASIVMSGQERYTVALGMRFFQNPYGANWPLFAAASILASAPIAVVFYSLQRFLVQGLTKGAMKG